MGFISTDWLIGAREPAASGVGRSVPLTRGQRLLRAALAGLALAILPTIAYLGFSWAETVRQENRYLRSLAAAALAQVEVAYERIEELLSELDAAGRRESFCSEAHVTRLRDAKAALPATACPETTATTR